jgi:hypothetical protein
VQYGTSNIYNKDEFLSLNVHMISGLVEKERQEGIGEKITVLSKRGRSVLVNLRTCIIKNNCWMLGDMRAHNGTTGAAVSL